MDMERKQLRQKLVAMRNSIQDYLDNIDMDEVEVKPEKGKKEGKPEKPEKDGKSDKDEKED